MEAVCTSEMSVHFNMTTRRYIPEDSKLQEKSVLYIVKFSGRQNTAKGTEELKWMSGTVLHT
jgi:hypothetical protein